MQTHRRNHLIQAFLLTALIVPGWLSMPVCQAAEQLKVSNVQYEASEKEVIVTYDLTTPDTSFYSIALTMRRKDNPAFLYRPVDLSGDVGDQCRGGKGRRIVWNTSKEFPEGIDASVFYFDVAVLEQKSNSSIWWWVGGGAAVAAGAAILLLNSSSGGSSASPWELPDPPGRP